MAAIGRVRNRKMGRVKGAVLGFAALLAAVAWIIALVVTDADHEQQRAQAESRASNLALVFGEQIYRQILSVDQTLRAVKSEWERSPANFDFAALRRRYLPVSDLVSQIAVLDARGHVAATTRRDQLDVDLSGRHYYQLQRGSTLVGPLVTGPFQLSGTWSLNVSRRLEGERGSFGGLVSAFYELDGLAREMAQTDLGPRGMIMLVGRDGAVRAMSQLGMQDPGGEIRSSPLYRAVTTAASGVWTGPSGPDQAVLIHAWRHIPGQELTLIVGLNEAAALDGVQLRRRQALLGTAGLTLLVLLMAGGVAAIISSAATREQRLAQDREVLEAANLRLAEARERADEKSLQLGMTLAGMSDGISMFDAGLRLVQWNDRYADLNGLAREALRVGLHLSDIVRLQSEAGEFGGNDLATETAGRIHAMQDPAQPRLVIRRRADGSVTELRRTWLPNGGLVTLYTDITTRKQVEDAQSRAREEAEVAAQEKSRFVAIVSHEIRTPLNVALNILTLLDRSNLAPAQRQLVGTGLLAGESLMGLLNDILDLSRMQVGRLQLRPAAFHLQPMLDDVVRLFHHQAEERGIAFSVRIAPGVPARLFVDSGRLRQALMNLVNNAAKFASPGPASIRVDLARLQGEAVLRFAVRDSGPDIPVFDRERLFRPFVQLHQPGSAGTGLGLAICQLLTNLLDGEIGCDSLPDGKEFWLTLPAKVMDVPDAPDEPATVAEAIVTRLPRTRILLVEDIPANQVVVSIALRREGHMVDLASSGPEALLALAASAYDVVLLDILMPGMDGVETARRIRAIPGVVGRVPIVALTANASPDDRAAYLDAGMDDLIAKPVHIPMLLGALTHYVWRGMARGAEPHPAPPALTAIPQDERTLDAARVQSWRAGLRMAVADALFTDCLRQLRDMVPALQTALELQHPAALKRATHAMVGVAGNYGLAALEAAIRSIAAHPEALDPDAQAARVNDEIDQAEQAVATLSPTEMA